MPPLGSHHDRPRPKASDDRRPQARLQRFIQPCHGPLSATPDSHAKTSPRRSLAARTDTGAVAMQT